MQWNCQGLRAKYEELKLLIQDFSPIVIALQETKLDSHTPCPRNYSCFRTEYDPVFGCHGGSLLYVRQDIPHISLPINTSLQAVAVQVSLKRQYSICSLYLPPNNPVTVEDLKDLLQQLPKPFIILGDLNARHPVWGDIVTNQKGNIISSLIEAEDLGIMNTGEPTHYHIQTGSLSCIDLALCSSNCMMDFQWRVDDDLRGSDHFPTFISSMDGPPTQRSPRWCLEKADWQTFSELSNVEDDVELLPSVDAAIEVLNNKLHYAGIESIPRSSGIFSHRPVPWWSDTIRTLHRATRRALTHLRRHRNDENLIAYKKSRALLRRTIKEAKRRSWSNFVSTFNSKTPTSLVWKKMRKISGKFSPNPPPVIKINGFYITDAKEVGDAFAEHFANISKKSESSPGFRNRLREELLDLDFTTEKDESYNRPFSIKEYDSALASCGDTAPGLDDIPYAMLKHVSINTKTFIISLINRIWQESSFPKVWDIAIVLPFSKPGKDSTQVSNYRPIALTSCLCKVMEKMVNTRLVWYLERKKILTPLQCGFRRMHSTTDVLIRLEKSICEVFARGQHHISVFFDLEKAYDTTWRFGILKALHRSELRGEMPLFIKAFLSYRYFQVKVGNTLSERKLQEEGVPQGSVLSVTLFALAINGIAQVIPSEILATLFVDDISISFSASKMAVAERKLQLTINKVVEWAERNGFKFSATKTTVMHFCRIRGLHPDPDLFLKGNRIPCVEETRFLGMIFDKRLTWVPHLKALKTKCLKTLQILRVLSHTSWGADRTTMLRLHHSLVLSKLFYGCEVYSSATTARLRILDSIHHSGVRLATGAFRSSPISSLLVDAGELPLDLYRQQSLVRYWYRLQRLPDSLAFRTVTGAGHNQFYHSHSKFPHPFGFRVHQILSEMSSLTNKVLPFKFSAVPPWELPPVEHCKYFKGFKKNMTDVEMKLIFLEHVVEHEDSVLVFTDGSKSGAGTGFGVHAANFSRKGALLNIASNFSAELYGVVAAMEMIASRKEQKYTIFVDSKSVLQALESYDSRNSIVIKILEWLHLIQRRGREIKFCWVPAHVGVSGNESADLLAKDAAVNSLPLQYPIPYQDFISPIKREFKDAWQFCWDLEDNNKMKEIANSIRPWTYFPMPRKRETVLCRLRIGHTRLTHGHLMSRDPQPFCDDCLVPLTVKHILVECPTLRDDRNRYMSGCRGERGDFLLSKVLGHDCDFENLFSFIERAGLLNEF